MRLIMRWGADNIVVTEEGYENLTELEKEVEEIEALVNGSA